MDFVRFLQENCRSIVLNKEIPFRILTDACDADIVIGPKSWLYQEIPDDIPFYRDIIPGISDLSAVIMLYFKY